MSAMQPALTTRRNSTVESAPETVDPSQLTNAGPVPERGPGRFSMSARSSAGAQPVEAIVVGLARRTRGIPLAVSDVEPRRPRLRRPTPTELHRVQRRRYRTVHRQPQTVVVPVGAVGRWVAPAVPRAVPRVCARPRTTQVGVLHDEPEGAARLRRRR